VLNYNRPNLYHHIKDLSTNQIKYSMVYLFDIKAEHVYATVRTVYLYVGCSYHCHSRQGRVLFFCTPRRLILNHSQISSIHSWNLEGQTWGKSYWVLHH